MKNLSNSNSIKLFITDYASYNDGTHLETGKWVDVEHFSDADEFYTEMVNYFKDVDRVKPLADGTHRQEYMLTDTENLPKCLYSETITLEMLEKIFAYAEIQQDIDPENESQILNLWHQYCENNGYDGGEVYNNNSEFLKTYFNNDVDRLSNCIVYGDYHTSHDYVTFDGYGNLKSSNHLDELIDKQELLDDIAENPESYTII